MAKSKEYVEQIQSKLETVATREQMLIQALGEALSAADRKLLDDVRSLTVEHETRRALILSELQILAERIGTLPASEPLDTIEYEPLDLPYEPNDEELEETEDSSDDDNKNKLSELSGPSGGDWRQALENIRSGAGLPVVNGTARRVS